MLLLVAQFKARAALLTVTITGAGTISPDLRGADLVVGKTYSITAKPAPGYLFENWGSSHNTAPTFKFTMQEGLTIFLTFVPNPFIARAGTYTAISSAAHDPVLMQLNLTTSGAYSCKLLANGLRRSVSGRFSTDGTLETQVDVGPGPLATLSLGFTDNPDGIGGYLSTFQANTFHAEINGYRAVFDARTNPATAYEGRFAISIQGPEAYGIPSGDGYISLSIDLNGRAKAIGKLSDGASFSSSSVLGGDGTWMFFASPYGPDGSIHGFFSGIDVSNIYGNLQWLKPQGPQSRPFPDGVYGDVDAVGVRYTPPISKTNQVLALTNWIATCEGANLSTPLELPVGLGLGNKISNQSTNTLVMKLDPKTGIFTGTIGLPGVSKPSPFCGIVFQGDGTGHGQIISGQTSDRITFAPTD